MGASLVKLVMLGFVAGFLATLIFHQSVWYLLVQLGAIPSERPAWPLDPISPFGVPSVISKAFWGGLWGAALTPLLVHLSGGAYWVTWIVVGAFALTLVAIYVVPVIKGMPVGAIWPRIAIGATVNGAWGLGTALLLRLFGVKTGSAVG